MKKILLLVLTIAALTALWWRMDSSGQSAAEPASSSAREIDFVPIGAAPPAAAAEPAVRPAATLARSVLRGRCLGPHGESLAGVEIECVYPLGQATSGADGRFELTLERAPAPSNVLRLRARTAGMGLFECELSVAPGDDVELDAWRLTPGARLRGRVRDGAGAPLAGLEVRCTRAEFACDSACTTPRGPELCSAVTDADGAFELVDAPAGALCVWAGAYGRTLWVSTPSLEVRPGASLAELELVTPLVARESLLGVRVLDPRGHPVAGAQILYRFHDSKRGGAGRGEADESGRWILDNAQRAPHVVLARDPRGRWQPTHLAGVQPGAIDVPLTLGEARRVELRVRDTGGAPVASYSLSLSEATADELAPGVGVDRLVLIEEDERPRPDGRTLFDAPSCPFTLNVRATGAFQLNAGPYRAESLDTGLDLVLSWPPGITGQVRSNGAGLAGVTVSLHTALRAESSARYGAALATTTSDEHGAFALPCEVDGVYWLRASAPQRAPADVGPLEVMSTFGSQGNLLELTRGGAIEGLAHPAHGESAAGVTITARRGDGLDRTTHTDADGAFRFDELTPGAWVLERSPPPAGSPLASAPMATVSCDVAADAVTRVELPAPDAGLALLSGELTFGGAAAAGWTAQIDGRRALCDESGAFELVALAPGVRRIEFTAPARDGASVRLQGEVLLRVGANPWRLDQPSGRIQGRLKHGAAAGGGQLRWSWRGDGAWIASGVTALDASGAFTLPNVPAGRIELRAGEAAAVLLQVSATSTVDVEL